MRCARRVLRRRRRLSQPRRHGASPLRRGGPGTSTIRCRRSSQRCATRSMPRSPIANRWMSALGRSTHYPAAHRAYLGRCHALGQTKPTPLLLRYGPGDYNCLHQDLYGDELFPLQTTFLLADPARDFRGGELCLTTSRPRRQSRVNVVPLRLGEGAISPVRDKPEAGARGLKGDDPPRREHRAFRLSHDARHHLSRCALRRDAMSPGGGALWRALRPSRPGAPRRVSGRRRGSGSPCA